MTKRRRSIPASHRHQLRQSIANTAGVLATHQARVAILEQIEKAKAKVEAKEEQEKTITAPALEGGGKLKPAKEPNSGIHELTEGEQVELEHDPPKKVSKAEEQTELVDTSLYCPILKANTEKKTVTGVVLQPETVDAQGDIISEDVIEKAAENFLAKFNKATKLGFMHKNFSKKFELLQSFIAPSDIVIGTKLIKKGSWVMKVRVVDSAVWKLVKDGKIRGFSIGGKAKVVKLTAA